MIPKIIGIMVLMLTVACGRDSQSTTTATDARYGAPAVVAPRDMRMLAATPCAGPLGPEDLRALGFQTPGRAQTLDTGERACQWTASDDVGTLGFTIVMGRDVLVDTYRVRQFAVFEPGTVAGLPAVAERSTPDSAICNVTVGTASDQGFIVDLTEGVRADGRLGDPCGTGRQVAERIVAALPPLSK
jgi:hypothetical protein